MIFINLYYSSGICHKTKNIMERHEQFDKIRNWAEERGIYAKGDVKTQYVKLAEEFGELGKAILKEDYAEFKDAIGDMVVVLTNLAHLGETSIEHCIAGAWGEIKNRKGKMENGTFVKQDFKLGGVDENVFSELQESIVSNQPKLEGVCRFYQCVVNEANPISLGFYLGKVYKTASTNKWPKVYCLINETGQERFVSKSDFIEIPPVWYECIGLQEIKMVSWASHFTIGKKYLLRDICNITKNLQLFCNQGHTMHVDPSQFKLVE